MTLAPCTCPYVTGSAGLPVTAHEAADLDPEMEREVAAGCKVRARVWAEDFLRRQGEETFRMPRQNKHEADCDCMDCRPWTY